MPLLVLLAVTAAVRPKWIRMPIPAPTVLPVPSSTVKWSTAPPWTWMVWKRWITLTSRAIDPGNGRNRIPRSAIPEFRIPLHVVGRYVLWHVCVFCVVILSFFSVQDDDGGATSINAAAKAVNPSSLFTSEGLQASYEVPDNIFDNSDESNDTVSYWF